MKTATVCYLQVLPVRVTGGNESNMEPTSFSLLASLGIRVAVEAIEVDEEAAHEDLLSRLSNDPL